MIPGVLPSKLEKWSGDDGKVLNKVSEEIAEPHKGSDSFYVNWWFRLFNALQLGLAWFDPIRS